MTLQIERRADTEPTYPATTPLGASPLARTRPQLYLVGEAERSTPRPVAAPDGRTTISINGRWHTLRGRTATFEQLLRVAFPTLPLNSPAAATISFRHGVSTWPAGLLTPGDVIELADGLLVNANATYAS